MSYKRLHSRIKGRSQSSMEQAFSAFEAEGPAPDPVFSPIINHPKSTYDTEIEAIRKVDAKLGLTFERLNTHQRHAVFQPTRHAILSAMVGSGKTTVLIAKIFYLHFIKKVPFDQLVVLTFTNKAAREIKERIAHFLGDEATSINEELRFFGTFHGVARQLLQEHPDLDTLGYTAGFAIMDEQEKQSLLERLIAQENFNIKYQNKLTKRWRNFRQTGEVKMGNMKNEDDFAQLFRLAQEEKKRINTMDFGDLISLCNTLLSEKASYFPQWIVVDEFQDCNEEQLQLIEHLKGEVAQLFVVGDQNQSIYGWRGSKAHLFQETQERWATTWMELPQNYRSTKTILSAAETLLQSDQSALIATRHEGDPIALVRHYDDQQEAYYIREQMLDLQRQGVALHTVAVLFRTHQQIGIVETVLQQANVPFQLVKRTDLHEDKAQAFLLSIFKACINHNDFDACLALICNPTFGVVKRSQSVIRQLQTTKTEITALQGAIQYLRKRKSPLVFIDFLEKVEGFASHFLSDEAQSAEELLNYLGLNTLLKPTSIHYKDYLASITEAWSQLTQYQKKQTWGEPLQGFATAIGQVVLEGTFQINERIKEVADGVHLLTIHASKGLEFDRVYVAGVNTGIIPLTQHQRGSEDLQEEKRLLFVAMTRGKNYIELGWHAQPTTRNTVGSPSYFLNSIPESLLVRRSAKEAKAPTKQDEWTLGTTVKHKKYGEGEIISLDDKALVCRFDSVGEKSFSRAFAKALLALVEKS